MDYKQIAKSLLEEEQEQQVTTAEASISEVNGVQYAELPNGVKIFNSTPHPINFWESGWANIVTVPSMEKINARPNETVVRQENNVTFVKTEFVGDPTGQTTIDKIKSADPTIIIVGSIIAAQAYPGDVVAMTPAPGFERVPPAEKRMNPNKFTTFEIMK